jgi:hypothetical protein
LRIVHKTRLAIDDGVGRGSRIYSALTMRAEAAPGAESLFLSFTS